MIERFDLDIEDDFIGLDWGSMQSLIELADLWRARARLRSRWLMRAALDALPDFHIDQLCDTYSNDMKGTP